MSRFRAAKRSNIYRQLWLWGLLAASLLLFGCGQRGRELALAGRTMGTTYSVKLAFPGERVPNGTILQANIDAVLAEVNRQMSVWDSTSEISAFNRLADDSPFPVSSGFAQVMAKSLEVARLTDGAFDVTVAPLVDLWGFGAGRARALEPPSAEEIRAALERVGYRKLKLHGKQLVKTDPALQLDLSAIAKGYGVDAVALWLAGQGFTDFMVEIGGEVYCRGRNAAGRPWRIGIDTPRLGALPGRQLQAVVALSDRALATSGDYRNYFEYGGKLYSHVVDPRSGYPVETQVASASVLAPSCMEADALATALMVMGAELGLELIEKLDGVEALLIIREGPDRFRTVRSPGMKLN